MGEVQIPESYRNVTFEEFLAGMQEIRESYKEIAESQKETDRIVKESRQDFDRQTKEFNRRFGDFTNRFGEMVEYMVAPNLRTKFKEIGLNFMKANPADIADEENEIYLEIDVLLENTKKAMLVEVKSKLKTEDVKDHIKRLKKMRVYANLHEDKRVFLGAVAGVVMTPLTKKYALEQGLYVVEPSGETFNITSPEGKPKEW
jgi:Holliday junction resolvase-like predicted endonuclease